jgi:hypothetical protein
VSNWSCITPLAIAQYFSLSSELPARCLTVLGQTCYIPAISPTKYALLFLGTVLFEIPIYFAFLRKKVPIGSLVLWTLILNLATHPAVSFLIPRICAATESRLVDYVLWAEIFAPVVEALLLWKIARVNLGRAAVAALIANLLSWWAGIVLLERVFAYLHL